MRHALVLAGGSGTRLWPYSTRTRPKQTVPLFGGRSLLELAVARARAVVPADAVWVGAGPDVAAAVRGLDLDLAADRVVVEPAARDTLPAVALGCSVIAAHDPDAVVAVLTADHLIEPLEAFAVALDGAFGLAESGPDTLVTFGVRPDHPATGYGYLQLGEPLEGAARRVTAFREKPPLPDAERFLAAGPERYLWNSGMFVWRAATVLRAVERYCGGDAAVVAAAARGDVSRWAGLARRSVDVAVMEPAATGSQFTVAAVPLTARWVDVGAWPAYGDALGRDAAGNAVQAARAVVVDAHDSVVASSEPDHLVAVVGCDGVVVVHTPTATLVVPAAQAQRVKELVARVAEVAPDLA